MIAAIPLFITLFVIVSLILLGLADSPKRDKLIYADSEPWIIKIGPTLKGKINRNKYDDFYLQKEERSIPRCVVKVIGNGLKDKGIYDGQLWIALRWKGHRKRFQLKAGDIVFLYDKEKKQHYLRVIEWFGEYILTGELNNQFKFNSKMRKSDGLLDEGMLPVEDIVAVLKYKTHQI